MNGHTMRVLLLAYFFPPYSGSGAQRTLKFAKFLPHYDVDVTVLCATRHDYVSAGDALDESLLAELPSNVRIARVPSHRPFRLERLVGRFYGRKMYRACVRPDVYRSWRRGATRRVEELHRDTPFDVLYASGPPWTGLLAAADAAGALAGLPLVLDFRDPWTQLEYVTWSSRLHFASDKRMERYVLGSATAIICNTNIWREKLLKVHKWLDSRRVHVIPNGYDEDDFGPVPPKRRARVPGSPLKLAFVGSFWSMAASKLTSSRRGLLSRTKSAVKGLSRRMWRAIAYSPPGSVDVATHSPYYLLHAVKKVLERNPQLGIHVYLTRTLGNPYAEELVDSLGLKDHVDLLGNLPHAEGVALMKEADLLFLPLGRPKDGIAMGAASGKIFEYLASGTPILAAVPTGECANIISRTRSGYVVDPVDTNGMSKLLETLTIQHSQGGTAHDPDWEAIRCYERRVLTRQLVGVFEAALEGSRR